MPYRRLPNTDAARLRAMKTALQQFDELGSAGVPFNNKIVIEIRAFTPIFESAIREYKDSMDTIYSNSKRYQDIVRNTRMYVSHFIQVLNLACLRGEIKPENKLLYKLLPNDYTVPDLSTETLLKEWGKNIIDGETERTLHGGLQIYNPAIAKVKVHYDLFCDAFQSKKVMHKNSDRFLDSIQRHRTKADTLILDLWNQIEGAYAAEGVEAMQEKSKQFGVVYYLRRDERKALGLKVSSFD